MPEPIGAPNGDPEASNDSVAVPEPETPEEFEGAEEGDLTVAADGKVLLEKNDRSLAEFFRWFKAGRLIVDPEWQRRYVWDRRRASKLIESFLIDIPVPVIYFAKNDQGRYEVIDGLQRLTSVFDFFDNKYSLRGLEIQTPLNGKYFRDLPTGTQNKLQDVTMRTFELDPETDKDLMFVIFERLNTGGVALNDMEIRNCLYRGTLNNLIKSLAANPDFLKCVNQQNIEKRMYDRSLGLRFLAFYERTFLKARQGLKRFLNEFYETYRNPTDAKLREYELVFNKAMKASVTIFGDKGFRLRKEGVSREGEWATRVNAAIFQVISVSFAAYDLGQLTRRADSVYEEYLDLISSDATWVDYVRRATGETSRIEYVFNTWFNRLAQAVGKEQPNDAARCFSRSLKVELFSQDRTCTLCGQEIKLLDDAAIDHEVHYWRGGRTIPENARLAHRHCNNARQKTT